MKSDLLYADAVDCWVSHEGPVGDAILWRAQCVRSGLASWQKSAAEKI